MGYSDTPQTLGKGRRTCTKAGAASTTQGNSSDLVVWQTEVRRYSGSKRGL
jgi:hypothetical protein